MSTQAKQPTTRAYCLECYRPVRLTYPDQALPYHKASSRASRACPGSGAYVGTLDFLYPDMVPQEPSHEQ
jgi:hypothetical protein